MSQASLDDIVDFTARFREAAYDDLAWPDVMARLKRIFNSSQAALGYYENVQGSQSMLYGDCSPDYEFRWDAPELANPYLPVMVAAPAGAIFSEMSLMPRDDFRKTTFYNEWFRPQGEDGCLVAKPTSGNVADSYLMLQRVRGRSEFDDDDEKLMRLMLPIIGRTLDVRRRVGAARLSQKAAAYGEVNIGFLVVNAAGRILEANSVAQAMLVAQNGFALQGDMLTVVDPRRREMLRQFIADASGAPGRLPGGGGDMMVQSPQGHPALAVSIMPCVGGNVGLPNKYHAFVFLRSLSTHLPPRFEERMRALFSLTRKEAALAAALIMGQSLADAAEARFVSIATARTQLAQIFRKTGTQRQSQLISLILSVLSAHSGL